MTCGTVFDPREIDRVSAAGVVHTQRCFRSIGIPLGSDDVVPLVAAEGAGFEDETVGNGDDIAGTFVSGEVDVPKVHGLCRGRQGDGSQDGEGREEKFFHSFLGVGLDNNDGFRPLPCLSKLDRI